MNLNIETIQVKDENLLEMLISVSCEKKL